MTKEEIVDNNKLIAKFMDLNQGWAYHESEDEGRGVVKYHSSWEWLMLVVEKIGNVIIPKKIINNQYPLSVLYNINKVSTMFEIGDGDYWITDSGNGTKNSDIGSWKNVDKSPLERTYIAAIAFVIWYSNINHE